MTALTQKPLGGGDDPLRCHSLTVPKEGDRCDGCGVALSTGMMAEYRLDGALFHSKDCAALHDGIPMDTSGGK